MSTKKLDSSAVTKLVLNAGKDILENKVLAELIGRIRDLLPDEEEKEEKVPAVKKQYVVLVSDPARTLPDDFSPCCWVLQIPDDEAPQAVESFIIAAAEAFNETKRGRALPVQTIGEACESIPAKLAKEYKLWVKTKSPTYALVTRNELPNTDSLLGDDNRGGPKISTPDELQSLWPQAILLCRAGPVSTAKLQRELKCGYNDASALMDHLRDEGFIPDAATDAKTGGAE